jgi:thiamine-phosphate pyrophosphorylase
MAAVLDILVQGAAIGAPLWLAALGGCLIERAGLFNLALEGTMLAGAWAGAAIGIATGSPAAAVAGAAFGGVVLSALFAVCVLAWRLDQVVTGTALNLLALGGTAVLWRAQLQTGGRVPVFVPWQVGPVALQPLAWAGLLLAPLMAFGLFRTRPGLLLRACGEGPAAARAAGIAVARVQTLALLAGGARWIQVREKRLGAGQLVREAREVVELAKKAGALVVVNDRVDVARIVNADGVHVGRDDLPAVEARELMGEEAIVGVSTHSVEEGIAAARLPVDYVAIGPVFATSTKRDAEPVVGLDAVKRLADAVDVPIVAIGGITEERAGEVLRAGARAVAVIAALYDPRRPIERNVAAMLAALETT